MVHKLLAIAVWASLAFIAYATLSPIQARPKISSADLEHIVAFAATGLLFYLAYPKQIVRVCCIVLGSAVLLEYLQTLTLDRHSTLVDPFASKMLPLSPIHDLSHDATSAFGRSFV